MSEEVIEHLGKFECGHVSPFVGRPIIGWWEWCRTCQDFQTVVDGVSRDVEPPTPDARMGA